MGLPEGYWLTGILDFLEIKMNIWKNGGFQQNYGE